MRWTLVLGIVASSCTVASPPTSPPTTSVTTTTISEPDPAPTTSVTPSGTEEVICPDGDGDFVEDGHVGLFPRSSTDAAVLSGIRWQLVSGCERIFVDFATPEGAPATEAPSISVVFLRQSGVVRINLGAEIQATAIAEQLVETDLVREIFAVRSVDNSVFMDIHVANPALVRVTVEQAPAKVVIDLRPGGLELTGRPHRNADIVIVEPSGPAVSYPFAISGYLRTGADTIEASATSLLDGSARVATASVASRGDTWSEFVLLLPDGPAGMVLINVAKSIEFQVMAA